MTAFGDNLPWLIPAVVSAATIIWPESQVTKERKRVLFGGSVAEKETSCGTHSCLFPDLTFEDSREYRRFSECLSQILSCYCV